VYVPLVLTLKKSYILHTVYISEKKQGTFPYKALTDWFL